MLGDMGRAEDMVQDAWLRRHERRTEAESPRPFLLTLVTRLCLNELDSARARREESRSDRLPEPVDLDDGGIARVEAMDRVSMSEHELNGQPALVLSHQGSPAAALLLGVADGRVQSVFFQADETRLGHLGRPRKG